METIKNRLAFLREAMKMSGISACIIPGTDPHASEYISDYWKEREWISGFNGSLGTVVITLTTGALWTDSRYFLQAADQLQETGIELMKMRIQGTPEITEWLGDQLQKGEKVAVNSLLFSVNAYGNLKNQLDKNDLQLVSMDLIKDIWSDRPALPQHPIFIFDVKYSGASVAQKLESVRKEMDIFASDVYVLSTLDDIAWLFNIRGNDVEYNPVIISYAVIGKDTATLFVDKNKVSQEVEECLNGFGVKVNEYDTVHDLLKQISSSEKVLFDADKLNQALYESLPSEVLKFTALSPVTKLKSIKNEVEIEGFRRAMVKDGVALTRFFKWLEENVKSEELTEISISEQLKQYRSEQDGFIGESFGTIAGYADHGAIVHYHATPETDATLQPEGILLIDSGGQYLDGTTDITRTFSLGKPTEQQRTDHTLVLKGCIALATVKFPIGTRGSQIDVLARKFMWDMGINYGHGTGHGIGHLLCVHEGPQSIRMEENPVVLQAGMVMSNEPGMYRTNEYGLRCENMQCVVEADKTEFGEFLAFETLTLFPFDLQLTDIFMLTSEEMEWLDKYHQTVYDALSPHLSDEEKEWLKEKCKPIDELFY